MTDPAISPLPALPDEAPRNASRRLTDVLVDLGFVSRERIDSLIETGRIAGRPPERLLLEEGAIDGEQLAQAVAEHYGLQYVDLATFPVDRTAARLLPMPVATRYSAVPIAFVDEHTVLVPIADPANAPALEDIAQRTRLQVQPAVATEEGIARFLGRLKNGELDETPPAPLVELREPPADAQAVELIAEAVTRGATALHLEPADGSLSARARVRGALVPLGPVPKAVLDAIKRLPATLPVGGRTVELSVGTLALPAGESAVVRLWDPTAPRPGLDALGLRTPELGRALSLGRGAVLVAGTSAAARKAALHAIVDSGQIEQRRVVFLEEVEGELRDLLDADPDILVIGALRDLESARIALEAALDGVLVLAGVPAPDGDAARARLAAMGVEPFLLEHAVTCSIAVRPDGSGRS